MKRNANIISRKKTLSFKIFINIQRIKSKLISRYNLLKYSIFIKELGNKNKLGKGLKIKPFDFQESMLEVQLLGENKIGDNTLIQGSGVLSFGARSFCGEMCVFGCNDKITIGEDVMIAQCVTIRDTDHKFSDKYTPMANQGISTESVTIKDNVWIGHGAIILKGVTINSGAIVAAGAVVNTDIEDKAIFGGIPARKIGTRK